MFRKNCVDCFVRSDGCARENADMKKNNCLNMLKPNVNSGFLEDGKGQEVTYLQVPSEFSLQKLESDVAGGAAPFVEVLQLARRKNSRFVIVNCSNAEEGLLAVQYLAAIYNEREHLDISDYMYNDVCEEAASDLSDMEPEYGYGTFEEEENVPFERNEQSWESESAWTEHPFMIPVIDIDEMLEREEDFFSPFGRSGLNYGRIQGGRNTEPFYKKLRKENICFLYRVNENPFMENPTRRILKNLRRYKNNRHVFMVVVAPKTKHNGSRAERAQMENPAIKDLYEIVLEYAAETVDVSASDDDRRAYHQVLFRNWVNTLHFHLESGFPTARIVRGIVSMEHPDKSSLIEKVVRYVTKNLPEESTLTTKDFAILEKFKALGVDCNTKTKTGADRLKNELVGMESVKEQIQGIVQIMKYNKRRRELGLPTGDFHNVHMLLGAPGTAKTTVAEILGKMLAEERLLGGSRFIAVNGAELKGMYVGHSAPKVKALFDEYDIIFIDEAYSVVAGSAGETDSFGQEAIAQLIVELEKHGMDRLVMFAGYGGPKVTERDNRMKVFLESNPGIRSRINTTIYFESYTAEEMLSIFRCHAKMSSYNLPAKADELVLDFFAGRVTKEDFGNGREARSLLENSVVEAAKRLSEVPSEKLTEKKMREIKLEDISLAIEKMKRSAMAQFGRGETKVGFAF